MTISRSLLSGAVAAPDHRADSSVASPSSACLTTDEILQLLLGDLSETQRDVALEHIGACADCRILFSSAAQALEDTGPVPAASHAGVFRPGTLVANRYRVERFVAQGGMGEVYAVRDTVLDEQVALKTVRSRLPTDVKAIRRLKSETLLSRRIGHPNTCRIFEFGEHELASGETLCFLTMELVAGETLGARLRRDGPLPVEQVAIVLRQVLGGLAEAHSLGIVHRDLKSDNIMLRESVSAGPAIDAVVMDFGLALRMDANERLTSDSHAMIGSAAYMAPEQVEGERLTPATDVYAIGVICFEMLTGQLPFRAATPASIALQRLHCPPPLPSSLRPELDAHWDQLVMICMQRASEQRFASAKDVLAALERPGAPAPPAAAAPPPQRRSRGRLGLLLAGPGLAALALLWFVAAGSHRPASVPAAERIEELIAPSRPQAHAATLAGAAPLVDRAELPAASQAEVPQPEVAPAPATPAPASRGVRKSKSHTRGAPGAREASPARAEAPAGVGANAATEAVAPKAIEPPREPLPASALAPLPLDPEFPE